MNPLIVIAGLAALVVGAWALKTKSDAEATLAKATSKADEARDALVASQVASANAELSRAAAVAAEGASATELANARAIAASAEANAVAAAQRAYATNQAAIEFNLRNKVAFERAVADNRRLLAETATARANALAAMVAARNAWPTELHVSTDCTGRPDPAPYERFFGYTVANDGTPTPLDPSMEVYNEVMFACYTLWGVPPARNARNAFLAALNAMQSADRNLVVYQQELDGAQRQLDQTNTTLAQLSTSITSDGHAVRSETRTINFSVF